MARGLIDAGSVRADGPPAVRPGDYARRLQPGERFEVAWDENRRYHEKPVERPGRGYEVLHRDDALIVIDKGPEVLSVPTALRSEDSLLERLIESERGRGIRDALVFPVHRLDRDTSGLLLFARTGPALGALKEQFADRSLERRYVAVVEGTVEKDQGRIESRVVENPRTLKVRSTRRPDRGREAITEYEVAERLPNATFVNVRLRTGRKNQIRVHFAESGHPVVGDHRYGRPSHLIRRTALHALRLSFIHPESNRQVSFESPLPADIRDLIRRLRSEPRRPTQPPAPTPESLAPRPAGADRSRDDRKGHRKARPEASVAPSQPGRPARGRPFGKRHRGHGNQPPDQRPGAKEARPFRRRQR